MKNKSGSKSNGQTHSGYLDNEKADLYCPLKDENFTQSNFLGPYLWDTLWVMSWFLMFCLAGPPSFDSKYMKDILYKVG